MKTIALFGGSFDPPHIGHIEIVERLKHLSFIDKIIIMPTYLNPFKKCFVADASLRVQWLEKIFCNDPKVEISRFEVEKQRKTTTIETVEYLLKFYNKIYLVIGADNLKDLHRWHQFDRLSQLVTFIVATRNNVTIPDNFIQLDVAQPIASSQLRETIDVTQLPKECALEIEHYYKEHNERKN